MSAREIFRLKLYVAGDAGNSMQARANLARFCRAYLSERHEIEVVDVLRDPKRARADCVLMTPTLVMLTPAPIKRIVGNLSQTDVLLLAFGLAEIVA